VEQEENHKKCPRQSWARNQLDNIIPCPGTVNAEKLDEQKMSCGKHRAAPANLLTRRQAIAGVAVAFVSVAVGSEVWGQSQSQAAKDSPGAAANNTLTSLHQETVFNTSPHRIYELLLNSKQFADFTGMKARIDPKVGGAFSMFGGMIVGRNVELIPDQRIVQAWRPTHWDAGLYSIVKFELTPQGSDTMVVLDHTGFPAGEFNNLNPGWKWRYWDPIKKYLAK
jgi:activator of HSP90 ATPase